MATTAEDLKAELGTQLIPADRVKPHMGVPTGWRAFDEFVLWHGLPKGALSLFYGASGFGATTLWSQTAALVTQNNRWCTWISSSREELCPWALKKLGVNFRHFMLVGAPRNSDQLLWALQEVLSLSLFEFIGCDLGDIRLRAHQLVKIKRLVQRAQCSLVLLAPRPFPYATSTFAVVMEFMTDGVRLSRALHRPTPFVLPRRDSYADLMPELAQVRAARGGRDVPHL
jgi:hypothetical protein